MTPDNQPALPDSIERVIAELRSHSTKMEVLLGREFGDWADRLESLRRAEGANPVAGWVMVPEDPDETMLHTAFAFTAVDEVTLRRAYMVMVDARPNNGPAVEGATLGEGREYSGEVECSDAKGAWLVLCDIEQDSPIQKGAKVIVRVADQHCPKCRFTMSGVGHCVNCATPTAQRVAAGEDAPTFLEAWSRISTRDRAIISAYFMEQSRHPTPPPTGEAVACNWPDCGRDTNCTGAGSCRPECDAPNGAVEAVGEICPRFECGYSVVTMFNSDLPVGTKLYTHPAAQAEGRESDLAAMAKWIVSRGEGLPDHACALCVPHAEICRDGFKCAYHRALDYVPVTLTAPADAASQEHGHAE